MKIYEEKNYFDAIKTHELAILAEEKKAVGLKDFIDKLIVLQVRAYIKHATSALLKMLKVTPLYEKEALMKSRSADWEIPYQLGRLNGAYTMMLELAKEKADEEEVNNARLVAPKYFDQIIMHLGKNEKDIQGNIAKALSISTSNLSNIIKRMSESGTVYCEASGKFHYYRLTTIGYRYWKRLESHYEDQIRECFANDNIGYEALGDKFKVREGMLENRSLNSDKYIKGEKDFLCRFVGNDLFPTGSKNGRIRLTCELSGGEYNDAYAKEAY